MLGLQLLIGTAMVGFTTVVHVFGIVTIVAVLRRRPIGTYEYDPLKSIKTITGTVLCIFLLNAISVLSWAVLYLLLEQFPELEMALYFSTVTYTTLGYGDVTLEAAWRMLGSMESINGAILMGLSTAFIFALLLRLFQIAGIISEQSAGVSPSASDQRSLNVADNHE